MSVKRIPDPKGKGHYMAMTDSNFEYQNPLTHIMKNYLDMSYNLLLDMYAMEGRPMTPLFKRIVKGEAIDKWNRKLKEMRSVTIPDWMKHLLTTQTKKEQERLLKGVSIEPDVLAAFLLYAGEQGYTLSQYTSEHHFTGLDVKEMPTIFEVDTKGDVSKVGETSLSDGQLRQVIEQRKVFVSKFLDKGGEWHCFFLTFRSLRGEESWKNGQPHYHYISGKFGMTRDEVVAKLKSKDGMSSAIHIELLRYR